VACWQNARESDANAYWPQCRIAAGAIDAAALGPFEKQAHGHRREVFSILVVISLVGTVSEKSLKLLPPDVTF